MKKLLLAISAGLLISGCGALAPKYDNVEYNHFVELTAMVHYTSYLCSEPHFVMTRSRELVKKALVLNLYASNLPSHKEIKEITALVLANLTEFDRAYWSGNAPSQAYCLGKLKIAENSLKRALPVIGGLQR